MKKSADVFLDPFVSELFSLNDNELSVNAS